MGLQSLQLRSGFVFLGVQLEIYVAQNIAHTFRLKPTVLHVMAFVKRFIAQMFNIGLRIIEERKRLGLTQDGLALSGGVSKRSQCNYESDKRSPDGKYLASIAATGVDIQYVITGVRTTPAKEALDPKEGVLIEKYRQLPDSDKAHLQAVVSAFANQTDSVKKKA